VNADIDQLEVILVPEEDPHVNAAGVKGIGELANVGTAAAIANAVWRAAGQRVRDLPIRLEKLLAERRRSRPSSGRCNLTTFRHQEALQPTTFFFLHLLLRVPPLRGRRHAPASGPVSG
jgi:hypothetical protein